MAQTEIEIFNLALSAIGTRGRVDAPDEDTREAQICKLWYPVVRDTALRAANWPSCRAVTRLALHAAASSGDWVEGDPEPPWTYRYSLPVDFLYPRWIDDFSTFALCSYANTTMLLANAPEPILTYTRREINCGMWDPDLYRAIVLGLSAAIALPLHGKADRANVMMQDANNLIMQARANMANENSQEFDSIPDWLMARGAAVNTIYSKYVYQYGPLFSSGAFL